MTVYSTQLGNDLRKLLFTRDEAQFIQDGDPVTYALKPGAEALAKATWAVHGVCLNCRRWTVAAGRCAECAIVYRAALTDRAALTGFYLERDVGEQCEKAAHAVRCDDLSA